MIQSVEALPVAIFSTYSYGIYHQLCIRLFSGSIT
jgi:hypothetical protein